MKYKKFAALALAALLIILTPGTARAEEITLTYTLNFGKVDMHRFTWNRLEVTVHNPSGVDFQGSLVVGSGGYYLRDVFIEAGKEAKTVIYLPPMEFMENWLNHGSNFRISLRDQRGREVTYGRLNVSIHGPQSMYVAVLGSNPNNFGRLANILPGTQVVGIGPEHLDNLLYTQNFRAVLISDPGSISLSPVQQANLRGWVESGGLLIIGGGSGWQQTAALVPSELLPVQPSGVETVPGADFAVLQLPVIPEQGEYTVAVGTVQGDVLIAAGTTPLLVKKALGNGAALWSALDLEAAPLEAPGNIEAFWKQVFYSQPPNYAGFPMNPWLVRQIFNSLSQDRLASVLSPLKILLLLLLYILLVGPVTWLILRKIDRREWAWLTIPALALVFTVGAFAVGRAGRGTEQILYQVNFAKVFSDKLAEVRNYGGIFVPRRGKLILNSPGLGLIPQEEQALVREEGGQFVLEFPNPPLWSVQKFNGDDFLDLPGAFSVKAEHIAQAGQQLTAEITNNSGQAMFDSYLSMGENWYPVGPLQAGETKSVQVSSLPAYDRFDIFQNHPNAPSAVFMGWQEFEQLLPAGPLTFLGFGDTGLFPVAGTRKTVALDIWIQTLDISSVTFSSGELNISGGMLTPAYSGLYQDSIQYRREIYLDGNGSFDLMYTLPSGLDYSQGEYSLYFHTMWCDQGTVSVFNFAAGKWHTLADLDNKQPTRSFLLENPADLIQENRLTVRVDYDNHIAFNLKGLELRVKGGRRND